MCDEASSVKGFDALWQSWWWAGMLQWFMAQHYFHAEQAFAIGAMA